MSDETPTQRFDSTPDAPTERFEQQAAPAVSGDGGGAAPPGGSRRLLIILASIGGALLIGVIVLLVLLLTQGSGDTPQPLTSETASETPSPTAVESSSPTPTPTPSESETAAPPPEPQGARFTSFVTPASVACSMGGPGAEPFRPRVNVAWTTEGAVEAWFVNGTSDAADAGFMEIFLNGDQDDFQFPQETSCGNDMNKYTITLVGPNGDHVSKTWSVENTGDNF